MLDLSYDKQFDVLHLDIADSSQSYGAEVIDGVNIFRDLDTNYITGFIIFGFKHKFMSCALPTITEPYAIDFEKDVVPNISF